MRVRQYSTYSAYGCTVCTVVPQCPSFFEVGCIQALKECYYPLNYNHIFDVQKTYYTFTCFQRIYKGSLTFGFFGGRSDLPKRIMKLTVRVYP